MKWRLSHQYDKQACQIADRHYSRSRPGTSHFVPPGRMLVLLTENADALWYASRLASRAALCYNGALNMVVAWDVGSIPKPRYKNGACTMDITIPQDIMSRKRRPNYDKGETC